MVRLSRCLRGWVARKTLQGAVCFDKCQGVEAATGKESVMQRACSVGLQVSRRWSLKCDGCLLAAGDMIEIA